MCEHMDHALPHERCHANGVARVVAEREAGAAVRNETAMQCQAIHDGCHAKFAHTVVDVTAHLAFVVFHDIACQVDAQCRCGRRVGEVGAREVGRAAEHFG